MCGICGVLDLTSQGRADPALVRRMADLIRHRGPDGDGFYDAPDVSLGMRRLSIIDVDGSDQPLYNEDGSVALVFNGEIYNYRELRADLAARGHALRTAGDGETIVHLYEEHGLRLFGHLRGMYAFALWDSRARRLLLAVDHIGMKPLYLRERGGLLRFASEVKAFSADPELPHSLNLETLDAYLGFGYMIGPETLFEGVRRLPPGHALLVENGAQTLHPFWTFGAPPDDRAGRPGPHDGAAVVAQARDLLAESVRLHLRSDVPLGLFLSGGVDSAAVLALMARDAGGRIQTYTIGYDTDVPDNELAQARRVAGHFATQHHERVISADDWWAGFERYIYAHDEPNANPSAVSLLLLAEMTARHVKVVLTGLGGDELFGGYPNHRTIARALRAQQSWGRALRPLAGPLGALEPYYPAMKRFRVIGALPTYLPRLRHALLPSAEALLRIQSFDGMVFSDHLRGQLYGPALRDSWLRGRYRERAFAEIVARSQRPDADDMAQALVINTWLTGNALLSQDKTAMAHALEARVPFFDPVLLDFAARVPPALRMRSNKYVLRAAMRPLLPAFALERPKQPFSTPILNWFEGPLAGRIQAVLRDPAAFAPGLFEPAALSGLLDAHFSGRARHTEVIFRLLTLALWQRQFSDAKPPR